MIIDYKNNGSLFDEVFSKNHSDGSGYSTVLNSFNKLSDEDFELNYKFSKNYFKSLGITYSLYDKTTPTNKEHTFPVDLFPRIIEADEWKKLKEGILQRSRAINLFIKDIYGKQNILKNKVVPHDLVLSCPEYIKEMTDIQPIGDVFSHISGTDLILNEDNKWYVLEDNVRNPSGVSYVLENRKLFKILFGDLINNVDVLPIDDYPDMLCGVMNSFAPNIDDPTVVLHTPGSYNSAYYEHCFLARRMGIPLVESSDMFVENDKLYMRTLKGPVKIDVVYRRIDDRYLDPLVFEPSSMLGVPGIMNAYKKGNVTIMNAPGCGVADDKAIYAYIPKIIKYYLNEDSILENVPTYLCHDDKDFQYVKENLHKLVIKPVNMSGGYGINFGNKMSKAEIEAQIVMLENNRRNYVAQPIMNLSTHTTYIEDNKSFQPRHIDLRVFSLQGNQMEFVLDGGLTRVALKEGSLVVNSSQGGGSKDTWIIGKNNN
ncbi:MAG: circularly permuted type 2 ATP-grasp protein [Chitinophagales bacterium]